MVESAREDFKRKAKGEGRRCYMLEMDPNRGGAFMVAIHAWSVAQSRRAKRRFFSLVLFSGPEHSNFGVAKARLCYMACTELLRVAEPRFYSRN